MLNYAHHTKEKQYPSDAELIDRIKTSEDDIANGKTVSLEQVRKKYNS